MTGFVSALVAVTTLGHLATTCSSFAASAIRYLYRDPSKIWFRINWRTATHLLKLLQKDPLVAELVKSLDGLAACGRKLVNFGEVERTGKWIVELLRACPNLQSVHSEIRYQGSTMLASETLGSLPRLLHLTLCDDCDYEDNLGSAQQFVREFRPAQGYLESLTILHFNGDDAETELSSTLPTPTFDIKRLSFIDNYEGPAWSSYFLPPTALNLVSLRFEEDGHMDMESQDDLSTLLVRASETLETFVLGEDREFGNIVGSLDYYGSEQQEEKMVLGVFPLGVFSNVTFARMRNLHLRGICRLTLHHFANICRACPQLVNLELTKTTWFKEDWRNAGVTLSFIIDTISLLSSLRILNLGHLPLLSWDPSFSQIVKVRRRRHIKLIIQFCIGPPPSPNVLGRLRDANELEKDRRCQEILPCPDYLGSRYPYAYETNPNSTEDGQRSGYSNYSMYSPYPDPSRFFDLFPFKLRYPPPDRSPSPSPSSSESESSFLPAPPIIPRLESDFELEDHFDDVDKEEVWEDWIEKADIEKEDRKWEEGETMEWEVREVEEAGGESEGDFE